MTQVLSKKVEKIRPKLARQKEARQIALAPSTGTLLPSYDESVDWDKTQNLFIEGDNLEVLKLLQKSYAGKVKLVYIDPHTIRGKNLFTLTTIKIIWIRILGTLAKSTTME